MLKLRAERPAERWRKTVEKLTLGDLREYWEFHNRTEGKSERTVAWYNEVLRKFERFLVREGLSFPVKDIGEPEVRTFIRYLQTKPKWGEDGSSGRTERLSPEGIQNRVRALKAFFNWLAREGYTDGYRLANLKNLRTGRRVIETLSDEEIRAILAACNIATGSGARDHAILTLMLDSGLRFGEVLTLRAADVDLQVGRLKVLGKGNRERIVPFGTSAQKALWRYFNHFRRGSSAVDWFFLRDDSREFTEDGFKSIFTRLAKRSGVRRLHPHLCRHTFATRYLMNGGDVFSLQQILGHSTLEMVRRYVNLASSHVAVQHRRFSPMDRIGANRRARVA